MTKLFQEDLGALAVSTGTAIAQSGLRIVLVLVAGYVAVRFLRTAVRRLEDVLIRAGERSEPIPGAARKRVTTLTGLVLTLSLVTIWGVAVVICLAQVGLDVTPILAGAGIVGLAVGFGAQNLVRDVISGFFLVLENQVRVGDVAVVNGTGGLVEAITFRTIVLRDLAGVVHVSPNGAIGTPANMTMGWSGYLIDVGVADKEDTDQVVDVMQQVAEDLRADPRLGGAILEPIEIPFPHHSLYMGAASGPCEVRLHPGPASTSSSTPTTSRSPSASPAGRGGAGGRRSWTRASPSRRRTSVPVRPARRSRSRAVRDGPEARRVTDPPTSGLRQDPTTREWVIVAPGRARRPHDVSGPPGPQRPPSRDAACPFCPGNEAQTPPDIFRIEDPARGGWAVRVLPNKFAALGSGRDVRRRETGAMFREMDGVGHHEVIVETPDHDGALATRTVAQVERLLEAYRARYLALREDEQVQYIIIFKNHGERAGTSLAHPHSQLVATPIAPLRTRRQHEVAVAHHDDTGRCLYDDLVEAEREARVRLIVETDAFVVFHPFASRAPFETWIVPRRPQPSFGQLCDDDRRALADLLRRTLGALARALGDPDFNYIVHSAPTSDENPAYHRWRLEILPRLTTIAGLELGTGIYVTSAVPEESAATLRRLLR